MGVCCARICPRGPAGCQAVSCTLSRLVRVASALLATTLADCTVPTLTAGDPSAYRAMGDRPASVPSGPIVGLGISGGGNRSALFASYVIELLGALPVFAPAGDAPVSFLSTVGYMSSVSGGSFAAAYFGMLSPAASPADFNAMLDHGDTPEPFGSFFSDYHEAMNHDWRRAALIGSQSASLSASNAQRLADALDGRFLHGVTFAKLDDREATGRSPYLIFNATHYDSGRRLIMTTIPQPRFCVNVEALIKDVLSPKAAPDTQTQQRQLDELVTCDPTDPLTPEGFDSIGNAQPFAIVSRDIPLSYAVAMSGAFPAVVGPVAYRVAGRDGYFHVIDGGVTDNSGVESIAQLFLRKLMANPKQRALIVELDAGMPFNAEGTQIKDTRSPLSTLAHDPSRLSDIQEVRAALYRQDLWDLAGERARGAVKKDRAPLTSQLVSRLRILTLRHTDLDLDSLRVDVDNDKVANGGSCHRTWGTRAAVQQAVRDLPTDYVLDDPCNVELTRIAACWSVYRKGLQIQAWFTRRDSPSAPSLDNVNAGIGKLCPELKDRLR